MLCFLYLSTEPFRVQITAVCFICTVFPAHGKLKQYTVCSDDDMLIYWARARISILITAHLDLQSNIIKHKIIDQFDLELVLRHA